MSDPTCRTKSTWKGTTVAGGMGFGNGLNQFFQSLYMIMDDHRTIYVSDQYNHRVVAWKANATSGDIVAGGNDQGIQSDQLNSPRGVIIDKKTDTLIIADYSNRRVVR